MKKILVALAVAFAVSALPAKADGTAAVIAAVSAGVMIYASTTAPHPSLADSCKVQSVKKEGANYSFDSYAHCK